MTLVTPKGLVLVTAVSSSSAGLAPAGRESGQDCEKAYGQAPMRSLLIRSVGLVGRLDNESTDHHEGIAPVPLRVRPEPRKPGWDDRSPTFAGCQHLIDDSKRLVLREGIKWYYMWDVSQIARLS